MPHISVRMSASSSTTRMSFAMPLGFYLSDRLRRGFYLGRMEHKSYARTAAIAILEHQLAMMVFHDFLDDRKPQSRAFGMRRHIGLDQAVAALARQAAAVILD